MIKNKASMRRVQQAVRRSSMFRRLCKENAENSLAGTAKRIYVQIVRG